MGVVQNIVGMVRDVNDRKREARIDDALRNYLAQPAEAIQAVMQEAPRVGIALNRQRETDAATNAENRAKRLREGASLLRGLPRGADYSAAIDQAGPTFAMLGFSDDDVGALRALAGAGVDFASLDDKAFEAMMKDRYTSTVATPGAHVLREGQVVDRVPFAPKTVTTRGGDGASRTDIFDPNRGRFVGPGDEIDYLNPASAASAAQPTASPRVPTPGGIQTIDPNTALGDEEGGALLAEASQTKVIGQSAARAIRDSMGPGGGAQFNQWLQRNGIRVVDDATASRAPRAAPTAPAGPAPQTAAQSASPTSITMPGKPAERYRPATAAELQGYPAGTAAQVNVETGELENVVTPPASIQPKPMTPAQRLQITNQRNALPVIEAGWDRIERAARAIRNDPNVSSATGAMQGRIPTWLPTPNWQGRQDVVNAVETLKSQIAINTIKEMREASKTGGALGNVSDRDMATLENSLGSLAFTQSDEQFLKTLDEIIEVAQAAPQRARDAVQLVLEEFGLDQEGAQPMIIRDAQGNRYRYKGSGNTADISNYERVQ